MRSKFSKLHIEATSCHRMRKHLPFCLVKMSWEMLLLSEAAQNPELCVCVYSSWNYSEKKKHGHSWDSKEQIHFHWLKTALPNGRRKWGEKSAEFNRTRQRRTAGKHGTDCGFNSMTCPGNPQSAGHLTQPWGEGLQEEERRAGCVLEEEEERKWNCFSAQGPEHSFVLYSFPLLTVTISREFPHIRTCTISQDLFFYERWINVNIDLIYSIKAMFSGNVLLKDD